MVKIFDYDANVSRADNLDMDNWPEVEWYSVQPIADVWPKQMRIRLNRKSKPSDCFPVGPLRVVSPPFMNVCLEFGVKAEFLPLQLLAKDGAELEDKYHSLRLLENVDCFDWEKSKFTCDDEDKDWIDEVTELVIDEEKAAGHHLFWIDVSPIIIGASEEFAEAVKRLKLKGPCFIPPSEWRSC